MGKRQHLWPKISEAWAPRRVRKEVNSARPARLVWGLRCSAESYVVCELDAVEGAFKASVI